MKQVFKYEFRHGINEHEIFIGAKCIHVDCQVNPEIVTAWFEVDTAQAMIFRRFQFFGTGHPVPDTAIHLGSVDLHPAYPLVWHLYELVE